MKNRGQSTFSLGRMRNCTLTPVFHPCFAMPRRARLILPNVPLHITQRGVNRAAIFIDDEDRHHYRKLLHEACTGNAIAVHAFVLMDNHVHLLLTPPKPEMLAVAMRAVGQSYVQFFNYRHGRSGTLWQGRFKSCLVDSDRYALTVCRYIELNPVRAAMAALPEEYRWSSVHTHLGKARDPLITPHSAYQALGATGGRASHRIQNMAAFRNQRRGTHCNPQLYRPRTCAGQSALPSHGRKGAGSTG